jgi:hypothetical protein
MGRLAVRLALPADGLFLHHGHSGPIHLHIQNRNRLPHNDRQIQLDGLLYFLPRASRDIAPDGLRRALHRFGCNLQAGQDLDLLATMIERSCRAHHRRHTADARRHFRIDNVQFRIGRELPLMTLRTQVIGTGNLRRAERREQRFGAQTLILRMMAARTWQLTVILRRGFVLQ